MKNELTTIQLVEIESHIDYINKSLDILDPSNAIEAQEIERKICILESYISLLQKYDFKKPRLYLVN